MFSNGKLAMHAVEKETVLFTMISGVHMSFSEKLFTQMQQVSTESVSVSDMSKQQKRLPLLWMVLLCVVMTGFVIHLWNDTQDKERLREDIARRFQAGDMASFEAKDLARSARNTVSDLKLKMDALERLLAKTESERALIRQMYLELAKDQDEKILAEIEQILVVANQELQLAGNVHRALIALESADKLLSRRNHSQFDEIRQALLKDMEKLRSVPYVDMPGLAEKLDKAIKEIDFLPLKSEAKMPSDWDNGSKTEVAGNVITGSKRENIKGLPWFLLLTTNWKVWARDLFSNGQGSGSYQRTSDASISSLPDTSFLRKSLALRILGARLAMLAKDHASFNSDIKAALEILDMYFDAGLPEVEKIKETLVQVKESYIVTPMPDMSAGMAAIQHYLNRYQKM